MLLSLQLQRRAERQHGERLQLRLPGGHKVEPNQQLVVELLHDIHADIHPHLAFVCLIVVVSLCEIGG